jgi:MFS family permease
MESGELQRKWIVWRSAPWWPAILLILVQTLNGIWFRPQLSFFPVYLQELGLSSAAIGGVVAGAQVAGMVVALLGGWVTGIFGSKWVLVCGLALSGLAATVDTVWGLFAFGVLGVAAAWSLSTLMYVWVSDGVAKAEHASSFGLLHAVWSLSMITGSLLGGSARPRISRAALPGRGSAQRRLNLPRAGVLWSAARSEGTCLGGARKPSRSARPRRFGEPGSGRADMFEVRCAHHRYPS